MIRVWLIWVTASDGYVWLESAWDDDSKSENSPGWDLALEKAKSDADAIGGEVRIQQALIPKVMELFKIPTVDAEVD